MHLSAALAFFTPGPFALKASNPAFAVFYPRTPFHTAVFGPVRAGQVALTAARMTLTAGVIALQLRHDS
jgi:hypothetical protein